MVLILANSTTERITKTLPTIVAAMNADSRTESTTSAGVIEEVSTTPVHGGVDDITLLTSSKQEVFHSTGSESSCSVDQVWCNQDRVSLGPPMSVDVGLVEGVVDHCDTTRLVISSCAF